MYNLFLDDERHPCNVNWIPGIDYTDSAWMVVTDIDTFKNAIEEYGMPEFISFDHDLGEGLRNNGYACAQWLVLYCADNGYKFPKYKVHSMNPVGKKNIIEYITGAKKYLDI